ncbi:Kelch repeat-containing protein [Emticicia fontis]
MKSFKILLIILVYSLVSCDNPFLKVDPVTENVMRITSDNVTATLKGVCSVNYLVVLDANNSNNTVISQGIKDAFTDFNKQGLSLQFTSVTANPNLQIKFDDQEKFESIKTEGAYQASLYTLSLVSGNTIYLNRDFEWNALKIKQVIMHTVGIMIGLKKSDDKTNFMYPVLSDSLKQLTSADKTAILNLLPQSLSTVTTALNPLSTGARFTYLQTILTNTKNVPFSKTGFCWSTKNATPTIADSKLESATIVNNSQVIKNLLPNQVYYFRSYVSNNCEVKYGTPIKVTTKQVDSWVSLGALPAAFKPRYESTVVVNSALTFFGKAYIIGGLFVSNKTYTNEVWEYYPIANTWALKAAFPGKTRWGATSVIVNNKLYYGLGYNGGMLSDWWEYDIALNKWTQKAGLPEGGRVNSSSFMSGATVMVAGGSKYDGKTYTAATTSYKYTPATNTWVNLSSAIPTVPGVQFSYSLNSLPYLVIPTATHQLYQYNASTNKWVFRVNMPFNIRNDAQYMSTGNKAFCGLGYTGSTLFTDWYEYNVAKNTWVKKQNRTISIRNSTKMTFNLENEKIYIIGGFNAAGVYVNEFWEYNPDSL